MPLYFMFLTIMAYKVFLSEQVRTLLTFYCSFYVVAMVTGGCCHN